VPETVLDPLAIVVVVPLYFIDWGLVLVIDLVTTETVTDQSECFECSDLPLADLVTTDDQVLQQTIRINQDSPVPITP